jgi:hypothetical protein
VWAERWWELDPDFRARLYRSAERRGRQEVVYFRRYPHARKERVDLFARILNESA